jgi:rubrerythrin
MADDDLWVCPKCKKLHMEDKQMWEEPHRCPNCGALLYDKTDNAEEQ